MRPSETLRGDCAADWQAIVSHPFCLELAAGTLPTSKMAWYLIQDYSFIEGFVRLCGSTIAHAPALADALPLARLLGVIAGPENTYFQRSFDALGVAEADRTRPELAPDTRAFQDLMGRVAASGSYARMVAVLSVAEGTYLEWASPHHPHDPDLPFYFGEWITLHSGEGFEAVVAYLRDQLDQAWERADADERALIAADFRNAVRLERAFFDAAYAA